MRNKFQIESIIDVCKKNDISLLKTPNNNAKSSFISVDGDIYKLTKSLNISKVTNTNKALKTHRSKIIRKKKLD